MTPWWQRLGYRVLGHHRLLLVGSTLLAVAQRLHLVPKRMGLAEACVAPWLGAGVPTGDDTWLFTGCVMDAWQRETHRSTAKVLGRGRCHATACPGPAARAAERCTSMPV